MAWTFEVVAGPFGFTEGPVWDGDGVLFSDIPTSRILRYDAGSVSVSVRHEDTSYANGLKLGPDGLLYVCEQGSGRVVRYEGDGARTPVAESYEGDRFNSPNDLAFGPDGRLWFSDPRYDDDFIEVPPVELDHFSVYRVDPDDPATLTRMTYDTTNPNGLLVSPDGETLYVAQSEYGEGNPRELRAYPIEGDSLGEYEVLHDFAPHRGIDGMCFTDDGDVVAMAGWAESGPGPSAYVFAPDGEVRARHDFPAAKPTNCAFGGADLSTLYATAGDGRLYRAETELTGYLGAP